MTKEKVLVIVPHPDDVDFACSGTMALWSKKKEISYVITTNGEKGNHIGKNKEEIIKIREKEQKEAAKTIGVKDVIFLGEKDGEVENTKELREKFVRIIRKKKPDIIFTFDPANNKFDSVFKYHPDHRTVALGVYDAIYPAIGNEHFFPHLIDEGLRPHEIKEIYFYGGENPNTWMDISSVIGKKIEALSCHKSQVSHRKNFEEFLKARYAEIGKEKGMKYAESFRKLEMPQ
ncbi:MAG: PIG-L deacetylase family protein [Candidatus Nanoarchaeia archaeon]|jgi:LmbE family N-acetylglucosaminyl deacetylase|nr:PIG-L deacetylase family protein [Candidatus Nanoarchaeia archaeon]|tara:strand:- start:34199 stop:34894 length:696 start_codon:yes stop_codon:yes gene_type:complete